MGITLLSRKKPLVTQQRDLLLLRRLCTFGYLTFPQIQNFVLTGTHWGTRRRLKKLESFGFLETKYLCDYYGEVVFLPNRKISKVFLSPSECQGLERILSAKPWTYSYQDHELRLRDIGLAILTLVPQGKIKLSHLMSGSDWWSGTGKDSDPRKVPDMTLEIDEKVRAIFEIELTQKNSDRYVDVFRKLFGKVDCSVVYLVNSPAIGQAVTRAYQDVLDHKGRNEAKIPKLVVRDFGNLSNFFELESLLSHFVEPTELVQADQYGVRTLFSFGSSSNMKRAAGEIRR